MSCRKLYAGLLLAMCLAAPFAAQAADGTIDVKLPYSIAYELAPIQIELGVKGANQAELTLTYHIYDMYKTEAAKGELTVKPQNGVAKQMITFTPPKWGWYGVQLYVAENGKIIKGWEKFLGVTPKFPGMHTLVQGELRGGWNDEALQAFTGLMLDRTNTRMGHQNAERVIADAQKFGVTLLVQFESAPSVEHVREWVTKYKGRVKYWEIVNEPNFSMNPQSYADLVKKVYPVIKEIDPQAIVMGPDVCGIDLGWYEAFYKNGGGKFVDAISIHDYEGHGSIDLFHWDYKLGTLRQIMARYGDANKPIWQTERAIGGIGAGFQGGPQALRITLQRDILETYGITNNHNNHYYANTTGYNDVATFVFSELGPHPAALMCRARAAMQVGRKFVEKIDFGPTGNKIFLGLRYQGDDGSTVMLRNLGCLDLPLDVQVKGGDSLEVVDAFGNSKKVAVLNGKATLTIAGAPCYVRLTKEQELNVPTLDFGRNIAREAKFTYSAAPTAPSKALTDGLFQSHYPSNPWGPAWVGPYKGTVFNDKPETMDMAFEAPRVVDKLLVWSLRGDNQYTAILDCDLQYHDGKDWVTLEEVRTPCPPSDMVETYPYLWKCHTHQWYLDHNLLVFQFKKPVKTDKLRLTVRRTTRGFLADMIAEQSFKADDPPAKQWKPFDEMLRLREIEIYGPPPQFELTAHARAAALPSVQDREPITVTVLNRTNKALKATAKVAVPAGWKADPAELAVKVKGGESQEQSFALIAPAEIVGSDVPVQLTLLDEKGETLDTKKLDLALPAQVSLQPGTPTHDALVLDVSNINAQAEALSGTARLELTVVGMDGAQGKTIQQQQNFGPLKVGEHRGVEFKVEGAELDKTGWTATYQVKTGKFVQTTSCGRWNWQVVGPFPYGSGDFDKANEPEKGVDLQKTYAVAGGKSAGWKPVLSSAESYIDLYQLFNPHENVCAYAVTYLKSPTALDAVISAGSDDGIKIWVNGKVVHANDASRGAKRGEDSAPLSLKAGWNEVLVKVTQGVGGWGFYFELQPAPGQPAPNVIGFPRKGN